LAGDPLHTRSAWPLVVSRTGKSGARQERFHSGIDDRRALLTHEHAVLNQEYALRTLKADQLVAMVDLMEALGGGYVNDLQIIQQKPEQSLFSWLTW